MNRQHVDPFRPQDYNTSQSPERSIDPYKKSSQLSTTAKVSENLEIYLPDSQYDDIDKSTNRISSPQKAPSKRRCIFMTLVVAFVTVVAIVVPVVVVIKNGQATDEALAQGDTLKNVGDIKTPATSTTSLSSTTPASPTSSSTLDTSSTSSSSATSTDPFRTSPTTTAVTTSTSSSTSSTTTGPTQSTSTASTTTTTTSLTTTTPPQTEMKMFGSETFLDDGASSVICSVTHPFNWEYVRIRHVDMGGKKREICRIDKGSGPQLDSAMDANKVSVTWNVTSSSLYFLLAFKPANCEDVGTYFCDLVTDSGTRTSVSTVTVKAMPSKPSLTTPKTVVAGRRTEISCTGNVGFPGGMMTLYIKDKETDVLREIGANDGLTREFRREECHNYVNLTYTYSPPKDGNDTAIVCLTENSFVATDVIRKRASADLQVLPGNICTSSSGSSSTVPFPFTCERFVMCQGGTASVVACPADTCYNAETLLCQRDGGDTPSKSDISLVTSAAILNASTPFVTCIASNVTGQYNLTISHFNDAGIFESLVSVFLNTMTSYSALTSRNVTPNVTREDDMVAVSLIAHGISCTDGGLYRCHLQTASDKISRDGTMTINAHPNKPSLSFDAELRVGRSTLAECRGFVGSPGGKILWFLKPASMPNFIQLNIAKDTTEMLDCSNHVVSSFVYTPVMAANGSVLKCVSSNENYPHISGEDNSDSTQLLLLTGTECRGEADNSKISHPYTCNKYIQCSGSTQTVNTCPEGVCFDSVTQTCLDGP
ncbi:uncharacterized protein [Haliotis cracherodii]|uniref:uncharacterized protein n=1 Tax=Haliotis cracherodii TaxID=6455 RepID=UPI0039EA847E